MDSDEFHAINEVVQQAIWEGDLPTLTAAAAWAYAYPPKGADPALEIYGWLGGMASMLIPVITEMAAVAVVGSKARLLALLLEAPLEPPFDVRRLRGELASSDEIAQWPSWWPTTRQDHGDELGRLEVAEDIIGRAYFGAARVLSSTSPDDPRLVGWTRQAERALRALVPLADSTDSGDRQWAINMASAFGVGLTDPVRFPSLVALIPGMVTANTPQRQLSE